MSVSDENIQILPEDSKPAKFPQGYWPLQGIIMDRQIPQPSSTLICFLSSLCTGLLFIIIILFVTFTRQGVNQMEHNMEVKLRNLSLGVHSRVEGLSQHGSQVMEKLTAMQSFVKNLKQANVMSKVEEIESLVVQILSDEVTGSLSNDNQRILAALGQLAEEIFKGNSTEDPLCDRGWTHHGSSCYLLIQRYQPWSSAKKDCEDRKGHLVVINDKEEMDFLKTFSQRVSRFWIGLKEEDNFWKWVDGTDYSKTPKFWQNFQPNYWDSIWMYSRYEPWAECGQMVAGVAWSKFHCSRRLPFLCEKKIP